MTKLSVVTPIYKAERYIERCVRSLMEQTLTHDVEFVFINDCTPDDSMEILRRVISEYPHRTQQIHIIENQQNLGPSDSRKKAFQSARGEYIACCDADDWVEPGMYEKMLDTATDTDADIVVCNYRVEEGAKSRTSTFTSSATPQDALAMMHERRFFPYAMWNQLIRKVLITEQIGHIIPTKIREDTYLMMRVYYHAKTIRFIPDVFYHYFYENPTSLVHSFDDSYDAWLIQKKNMDAITKMLYNKPEGYEKYHFAMNNFKYARKMDYRHAFRDLSQLYNEYRETHTDFVKHENEIICSRITRWKMRLVYDSNYYVYRLFHIFTDKVK